MMYQSGGRLSAQVRSPRSVHIGATSRTPEVFIAHDGEFEPHPNWYLGTIYRRESERGYSAMEDVWMPGPVKWKLEPGRSVHFLCSTDPIDLPHGIEHAAQLGDESHLCINRPIASAQHPNEPIRLTDTTLQALLCAADQFISQAADRTPAVMSGFPWQAVSGRDALISFTGLFLVPRRFAEAREFLRSFFSRAPWLVSIRIPRGRWIAGVHLGGCIAVARQRGACVS